MRQIFDQLKDAWAELTAPGSRFEIAEIDVRGHRTKVYKNAPVSLREVWLGSAVHGSRPYLVYHDEHLTYAEAHRQVASIANWLASRGVCPGDRVAIAMRNYPEWLLTYWATVSMGAVVVGVNAWWAGPELAYGLKDSQPKVIFCDQERLERMLEHGVELPPMEAVGVRLRAAATDVTPWAEVVGFGGSLPGAAIDPDDDACIFYTSGTTGHPKGAQLTHRGCVTNILNMMFWVACAGTVAQRNGAAASGPAASPTSPATLVTTPLFHVTANNCATHAATASGGKLVFMYKWDPAEALRLIEKERITSMSGVPTMARELITHPDFTKYDTSSLGSLGGGGAQLQPDLVEKIDRTVKSARPGTGYGMTETCGIITSISGDFFVHKPTSCGPPMPTYDVKLVDADGNTVQSGGVGELWVKGGAVIKGYLNRPEATAETITNGWLHTGDIARIDEDGFIYIVDRVKDMVLRGGENVYCAEVESCIYEHPAVAQVAVFGVPDARLGEEVGAAIYLRPDSELTAEGLQAHCRARISAHKVPRHVWFVDEPLPRNANGKFVKRELKARLAPATVA